MSDTNSEDDAYESDSFENDSELVPEISESDSKSDSGSESELDFTPSTSSRNKNKFLFPLPKKFDGLKYRNGISSERKHYTSSSEEDEDEDSRDVVIKKGLSQILPKAMQFDEVLTPKNRNKRILSERDTLRQKSSRPLTEEDSDEAEGARALPIVNSPQVHRIRNGGRTYRRGSQESFLEANAERQPQIDKYHVSCEDDQGGKGEDGYKQNVDSEEYNDEEIEDFDGFEVEEYDVEEEYEAENEELEEDELELEELVEEGNENDDEFGNDCEADVEEEERLHTEVVAFDRSRQNTYIRERVENTECQRPQQPQPVERAVEQICNTQQSQIPNKQKTSKKDAAAFLMEALTKSLPAVMQMDHIKNYISDIILTSNMLQPTMHEDTLNDAHNFIPDELVVDNLPSLKKVKTKSKSKSQKNTPSREKCNKEMRNIREHRQDIDYDRMSTRSNAQQYSSRPSSKIFVDDCTCRLSSVKRNVSAENVRPKRRSYSFSNERLREIERHNHILLRKILSQKSPYTKDPPRPPQLNRIVHVPQSTRTTSAAVNRKKKQREISMGNVALRRKIDAIAYRKPKSNTEK